MLKYLMIIGLLGVLLPIANSKIHVEDINSNQVFIEFTNLAVYMTKRFVSPKTNTLVITEKCEVICSVEQKYHTALLTNLLFSLNEDFAIQLFLGHYNDRLWDFNIFIVDSPDAFITLRYTFPITEQERFFNFFILLTWSANSVIERHNTLFQIFRTSLSFNVRNVVVMNKSFDGNYISFYTYELFNKGNCSDKISIREINRYENGTLRNQFLFPDHINNFHGCYLNVSAQVLEPLFYLEGDFHNKTHLMENYRLRGVEVDILKIVAKSLNFKLRLHFPKERNEISLLHDSKGCFRDLEQERANIVIGGFSSTIANGSKFSSSYAHHTTPFVFVVRSDLCFGPIKQLLNPLCGSTWTFLLIIFITSLIFVNIMKSKPELSDLVFGPKNNKPICSMFVVFFGNALPIKILPKKSFARFLLAAWLLLSFEVRNGYQGKMFDSLRFSKRVPVPQKISQLLDQDYTLLSNAYINFYPHNRTTIVVNSSRRLNTLQTSTLRLTAAVLLDSLAHYNFVNYKTSSLMYVDEAIQTIHCVMYFQKNSIFRPSIDRKLKILSNAGITSHVAKKHVRSWFQSMNSHSQFEFKLRNNNLIGVYFISFLMFLISIFVFILELLTRKSKKLLIIMNGLNSF